MFDVVLETERLRLRPYRHDDLDDLLAMLSDREDMRWYPDPFDREGTCAWIERQLDRYRDDGFGLWDRRGSPHRRVPWYGRPDDPGRRGRPGRRDRLAHASRPDGGGHRTRGRRRSAGLGVRDAGCGPRDLARPTGERAIAPGRREARYAHRSGGRPRRFPTPRLPDRPARWVGRGRADRILTDPRSRSCSGLCVASGHAVDLLVDVAGLADLLRVDPAPGDLSGVNTEDVHACHRERRTIRPRAL